MPYLEDNFSYIILETKTKRFVLVDPGDFDAVHDVLDLLNIPRTGIQGILTTHKHWDHSGHNYRFAQSYPGVRILAGRNEGVPESNQLLDDSEIVDLFDGNL